MPNLRRKINELLKFRKQNRIVSVVIAVLSLFVLTGVTIGLIMPAVSQEGEETDNSGNGTNTVINGVSSVDTSNASRFQPKVTNISVSYDENAGADADRKINVDFKLIYNIDSELLQNTNCITYNLNDDREDDSNAEIVVPEGGLPSGYTYGYVKDGSRIVGLYKIYDDGTVYIWFTDEYRDEVLKDGQAKEGTISFSASVQAPIENGKDDIVLDFGGSSNPVIISGFKYQNVTTDKVGKLNEDGTISWTVTINNPDGSDISGLVVEDSRFSEATTNCVIKDSNGTTIPYSPSTDGSANKFVLGDGSGTAITDKTITIEYTTEVPEGSSALATQYINNTAKISKPDSDTPLDDASATVTITPSTTIEKTGSVDYVNNTITWVVTINNPDRLDLSKYVLYDQKIAKAIEGTLIAEDSDGNSITLTRENEYVDDWKISSTTAEKVTVTYATAINEADYNTYSNSATVRDPEANVSIPGASVNLGKEFFSLSKGGYANGGQGTFTWNITFEDKSDNDNYDITDVLITDAMLIEYLQNGGSLTARAWNVNSGSHVNLGWEYAYDENNNIIGIMVTDSNGAVFDRNGDKVEITYQTPVDFDDTNESGQIIETNKVEISIPEIGYSKETEISASYYPRESIDKVAGSPILSTDGTKLTTNWTINVWGEIGDFENFSVTDSMSAKHDATGLYHTWNGSTPVITYKKADGTGGTIDSSYVTVVQNADGTILIGYDSTAIESSLGADFLDNVIEVNISYSTIVDVSGVDGINSGETVHIANNAKWNDKEDTATVDYSINRNVAKSLRGNATVSDDYSQLTIPWSINITGDKGAFNSGFKVDDIGSVRVDGKDVLLSQLIDINSFEIVHNGTDNRNLEKNEYKITLNADGTGFEFAFTDEYKLDYYDITKIEIRYNTTLAIDYDKVEARDKIIYENSATAFDTTVSAKGEYNIIDPDAALGKTSNYTFDDNGLALENVTKATIDGVECYMFGWTLKINENGVYKSGGYWDEDGVWQDYLVIVTDTLPTGHKLYTGSDSAYKGKGKWSIWGDYTFSFADVADKERSIGCSVNEGVVSFTVNYGWGDQNTNIFEIVYYTYIPVSELEAEMETLEPGGIYEVTNTVTEGEYSSSATVPVVVPETTEPGPDDPDKPDDGVLNKEGSQNEPTNGVHMPGYIYYSIDFNPDANDMLAGSDYITLTDRFNLGTPYIVDKYGNKYPTNADLNVSLEDMVFYRIDENGNKVKLVPQPSYTFETNHQDTTYYSHSISDSEYKKMAGDIYSEGDKYFAYELSEVKGGRTLNITVSEEVKNLAGFCVYYYDEYGNINSVVRTYENAQSFFADNGDGTYSCSVNAPADGKYYVEFINWHWGDYNPANDIPKLISATSSLTTTTDALLTMQVPDSTHIVADYVYKCVSSTEGLVFENTTNSVQTETKYGDYGDENTIIRFEAYDDSEATATSTSLYVSKVDASNNGLLLEASFGLARWNENASCWEFYTATGDGTGTWGTLTVEGGLTKDNYLQYIPTAFTTSSTGKITVKDLSDDYVYYLIETKWPDGYDTSYSEDGFFVYGTTANQVTLPTKDIFGNPIGVIEDIDEYAAGNTLVVRNRKSNLEITVEKQWADSNDHSSDSVTVQLYSSTTAITDGSSLPSEKTAVGEPIVLNASGNWTYTWTDLKNVDDDGNLLFYYVEELAAVDINGSNLAGYSPIYVNNGLNENGTITVKNSKGLSLQKLWLDKYGTDISDEIDLTEIKVSLYRSTVLSTTMPDISEMVFVKEVTLYAANGWKMDVTDLGSTDADGKTYYYYAVEETVDGYTVTYPLNGAKYNGLIEIHNTKESSGQGASLPSAGGNGTAQYIGLGILIMAIAGIALIIIRRKPVAVKIKNN